MTIGIIGVLGSILLTTLGRAKLKGYTVYSQNNLRQLSAAYIAHDVEMGEFMNYEQVRQGNWVKTIREREGYKKELFHSPAAIAKRRVVVPELPVRTGALQDLKAPTNISPVYDRLFLGSLPRI